MVVVMAKKRQRKKNKKKKLAEQKFRVPLPPPMIVFKDKSNYSRKKKHKGKNSSE